MKFSFLILSALFTIGAVAQSPTIKVERNGTAPLAKTINLSDTALQDWEPQVLTIQEQPKPASDYGNKKEYLTQQRKKKQEQNKVSPPKAARDASPPAPVLLNNFTANNSQSTPNDNHLAISNAGKIVSVG